MNKVADTFASLTVRINSLLKDSLASIQELKPPVEAAGPAPPASAWRPREFLFWKKPGAFVKALIDQAVAVAQIDSDMGAKAFSYAFGFLVFYSASICGGPFINSIIGGPYRTQWWRYRWINNHVDAWVHGYYEAGKPAYDQDPPDGAYLTWKDLCGSKLHEKIDVGSILQPAAMQRLRDGQAFSLASPDFNMLGALWFKAVQQAYGSSPLNENQWTARLNDAYVMTWLVLWAQTSGEVILCDEPPKAPPDCGDVPSWSNPAIPGDAGAGSGPPPPHSEQPDNSSSSVSGKIAAILGVVAAITGFWPAAVGAIVSAIAAAATHKSVDWAKVLCDVYYYRVYMYNLNNAIRSIVTAAGLMYPPPSALGNEAMGAQSTENARNVAKVALARWISAMQWRTRWISSKPYFQRWTLALPDRSSRIGIWTRTGGLRF
jgi:hypothetical protein